MKNLSSALFLIFSLSFIHASPWIDDAFLVIETDTPDKVRHLIATDYSLRNFTRNDEKENLLMAALKNARGNDIVDLLLHKADISPDSTNKDGVSAFMYACQYETDINAIENVLFTGARSDSKKEKRILHRDEQGLTCFDYARKNESISEDVLALLKMYAEEPLPESPAEEIIELAEDDTDSETVEGELPVEEVVEVAEVEPVPEAVIPNEKKSLMNLGALDSPMVVTESIYLYDYANDKYAAIEIPPSLIAAEEAARKYIVDASKKDSAGRTKLMYAAKNGDIALIENLIYSGADVNAKDEEGWTALMYAARYQNNPDVTKLLLYKGANYELKNNYGISALMLGAGYAGNPAVISVLLETYSPDSDEVRGAFAYGISNMNSPEALQAFIDKKVPLNVPFDGKTPLMLACQIGKNTVLIEWLLKNGASKYLIEAATGKTAYDYARENKRLPHNITYWSLNPNS